MYDIGFSIFWLITKYVISEFIKWVNVLLNLINHTKICVVKRYTEEWSCHFLFTPSLVNVELVSNNRQPRSLPHNKVLDWELYEVGIITVQANILWRYNLSKSGTVGVLYVPHNTDRHCALYAVCLRESVSISPLSLGVIHCRTQWRARCVKGLFLLSSRYLWDVIIQYQVVLNNK